MQFAIERGCVQQTPAGGGAADFPTNIAGARAPQVAMRVVRVAVALEDVFCLGKEKRKHNNFRENVCSCVSSFFVKWSQNGGI